MQNEILAKIAIYAILAAANVALVLILIGVGWLAWRGGPMFCIGCMVGSAFTFVAIRLKLGYWV